MSNTRSWISSPGYSELATKYGTVTVNFTGGGTCNVEVRDAIEVAGGKFRGCFTIVSDESPYGSIVGSVTFWDITLTRRREKLLLDEVLTRVREAAAGPMAGLVREAALRWANNDIMRAEEDMRTALKAVAEARSNLLSVLAHESSLLGRESTSDLLAP